MFFIFGVNSDRKEIGSFGPVICGCCGRYGRYQVYMTCMCLSLFWHFLDVVWICVCTVVYLMGAM